MPPGETLTSRLKGMAVYVLGGAFLLALITVRIVDYCERRANDTKQRRIAEVLALKLSDFPATNVFFGIEVTGDEQFRLQLARSLTLLQLSAPKHLGAVTNALRKIQESPRSGVRVTDPPIFYMAKTSAMYSVAWCAGSLSHDAYHVTLARGAKRERGLAPKSRSLGDFESEERECIRYQYRVLKQIGASQYEVNYLKSCKGTHLDLNGNGKYDWNDFYLRDW